MITIITPWHEHPELIPAYEEAVWGADQVVIVDNGSEDAAPLRAMCGRLGGVCVRSETNRYFSAANNLGYQYAEGDVVLFLNNDVVAAGDWLSQAREDITAHALYGPRLCERDGLAYLEGWCVGATRATWALLAGPWDAATFPYPYWEDVDLSQRALARSIALTPRPWPLSHIGNVTTLSVAGADAQMERNRAIVRERYHAR